MSIFEKASRIALRFPSVKGELTTEQLWDLPLQARNGFDLDSVAKAVNANLKSVTEESFVETRTNPAKDVYELQLCVVKHIIAVRKDENAAAASASARKAEREKLLAVLETKTNAALHDLTTEQLQARINELGSA